MALGDDSGTSIDFQTLRGRDYPTIRQFTVFLENRVGQLLEVVRRFEGSRARIVALNIHDSSECSIVRFVLSHPELGREILERAGLSMIESDLIGIVLPSGPQPLQRICAALLQAEINVAQVYPLLIAPGGQSAIAVMVDDLEMAQETLANKGFLLLTEQDLAELHDTDTY